MTIKNSDLPCVNLGEFRSKWLRTLNDMRWNVTQSDPAQVARVMLGIQDQLHPSDLDASHRSTASWMAFKDS